MTNEKYVTFKFQSPRRKRDWNTGLPIPPNGRAAAVFTVQEQNQVAVTDRKSLET